MKSIYVMALILSLMTSISLAKPVTGGGGGGQEGNGQGNKECAESNLIKPDPLQGIGCVPRNFLMIETNDSNQGLDY